MIDEPVTTASPGTAEHQLKWLVDASFRAPLPVGEIRRHLAPALLDASGGPDAVNAALAALGPLTLAGTLTKRPDHVQAAVAGRTAGYRIAVHVDADGRVDAMRLTPDEPEPASWAEIDALLRGLGSRVSFAAAHIEPDGRCRVVHGLDADTPRPIGSAFKLYVLGALAQAVVDRHASWDERLAIRDDHKSLPSGTLQNRPAGDTLPLSEYADHMISISDNTATDHLIHRLGRDAVVRQLSLFGHRQPDSNVPFLTTKAFFQLKAAPDAGRTQRYLALPVHRRIAAVLELERLPLPEVRETWAQPRHIDQIEWFASPADICHAYAGLLRLDQPQVGHALSLNDDGLHLDPTRFPTTWYKGGSEPGVVSLHYLARTSAGRALVTSLMVSDPTAPPDVIDVAARSQSVIRGAFHLLALPEG
ncbi:serine hydrolase [Microbispora amethystogenes]|uniref:serine hydrolase n=1 Tax=Microbispora amethystogenes TaxID=1427754 RepID=UPI0033D6D1B3